MPDQTRKLAAIMFTDIAGYTESMSYDEHSAIQAVKKKRSIIQPLIKDHNGVFVKEIGDGTLSYFSSAIDASTCAIKLQEMTYDEEHLNIRVGLHIGDIVFDGEDVFGEGVNIASRLESLSPVGGVCVSKNVFDELENKKEFKGESLGLQTLKGVGRLVEVYALKGDKLKAPDKSQYKATEVEKHTGDEVPSIAIIPFKNKGAEEDVFYAYGISADLITECSSAGLIRVASLNNIEKIESYQNLQAEEIANKLDVRYTAEGMLWKMGNMFQLSIELYDTKEQKVVWSDRWQENWENLPNIKSNLSDGLQKALDTKTKVKTKNELSNPEAYEYYLRGKYKFENRNTPDDVDLARGLLRKAIELDENFINAKTFLGSTYLKTGDYDEALDIFNSTLIQANHNGDLDASSLLTNNIGIIHFYRGKVDTALVYWGKALKLSDENGDNNFSSGIRANMGNAYFMKGELDKTLGIYEQNVASHRKLDNKNSIADNLLNLIYIYSENNQAEKSISAGEEAITLFKDVESRSGVALSQSNLGETYFYNLLNFDKAMDYFSKSLSEFIKIDEKRMLIVSYEQIGKIHAVKGEYEEAIKKYNKSLKIAEKMKDLGSMADLNSALGIVYYELGKFETAKEYLMKSLRTMEEIDARDELIIWPTIYLQLLSKQNGEKFDESHVTRILSKIKFPNYLLFFNLYKLFDDEEYLIKSYQDIQSKTDWMDEVKSNHFFNYPIPKQIVTEWEKVVQST